MTEEVIIGEIVGIVSVSLISLNNVPIVSANPADRVAMMLGISHVRSTADQMKVTAHVDFQKNHWT